MNTKAESGANKPFSIGGADKLPVYLRRLHLVNLSVECRIEIQHRAVNGINSKNQFDCGLT